MVGIEMVKMAAKIIDGKKIASSIEEEVRIELQENGITPSLVFIVVGNYEPTKIYVAKKQQASERVGIKSDIIFLPHEIDQEELINKIKELNESDVTGIIVQTPLPEHIDENQIASSISPSKDVDCMNPENIGKMYFSSFLIPCTVGGVLRLIEETGIDVKGKDIVIVNRSYIGKSLSILLTNKKATVTTCGRNSDLEKYTKNADIIISAAGSPSLIKKEMVKPGVIVIDVGITRKEKKIIGDVDEGVKEVASYITPVPGGVGPMTVAMLMKNTADLALK